MVAMPVKITMRDGKVHETVGRVRGPRSEDPVTRDDVLSKFRKMTQRFWPESTQNRAIDLCEGEWIKLFCHDDLMQSHCMDVLHRTISTACDDSIGLIGNGESAGHKSTTSTPIHALPRSARSSCSTTTTAG